MSKRTLTERVGMLEVKVGDGFKRLDSAISDLKDNDFHELKEEMSGFRTCMTSLKKMATKNGTNMEWLMKTYWIVIGTGITTVVVGLINLLLK